MPRTALIGCKRLTRWTRMHHVEPVERIRQRVPLMELERIMWLRRAVYADHLEARASVAHRSPTRPTEQVQQA